MRDCLKRLLATFRAEASEHLEQLSTGLVNGQARLTEGRNRGAGVSRSAQPERRCARREHDIEALCQNVESILSALKRGEISPYPDMYDVLHASINAITEYLDHRSHKPERYQAQYFGAVIPYRRRARECEKRFGFSSPVSCGTGPYRLRARGCGGSCHSTCGSSRPHGFDPGAGAARGGHQRHAARILRSRRPVAREIHDRRYGAHSDEKLDSLLLQSEELLTVKLITAQHTDEIAEISHRLASLQKEWKKIQPDLRVLRQSLAREDAGSNGANRQQLQKILNFLIGVTPSFPCLNRDPLRSARAFSRMRVCLAAWSIRL